MHMVQEKARRAHLLTAALFPTSINILRLFKFGLGRARVQLNGNPKPDPDLDPGPLSRCLQPWEMSVQTPAC